jgi:hypothetical protein
MGVAVVFLSGHSYDLCPDLPQAKKVRVEPPVVNLRVFCDVQL